MGKHFSLSGRYYSFTKASCGLLLFTGTASLILLLSCTAIMHPGSNSQPAAQRLPQPEHQPALQWTLVDSLFQPLPSSVHIYRTAEPIDGKPNVAYYLEANLIDKSLEFTTQVGYGKRYTPSEYYRQEASPLLVVNGTFFSFADNRNLNLVIKDGNIVAHNVPSVRAKDSLFYNYPFRGAIGVTRRRKADVAWIFSDTAYREAMAIQSHPVLFSGADADPGIAAMKKVTGKFHLRLKRWKVATAIAGGPVLVQQGSVAVTNEQELMFTGKALQDKHPRTAMGYTKDGRLLIMVVQGRAPGIAEGATLEQEARMLADLGCYEALNLDGGGSSCMLVNGKETIATSDKEGQRPVPAVFIIRHLKGK